MEKNIFIFLCIFIVLFLSFNVVANPLPVSKYSGSLIPGGASVNFISEEVTYVVNKKNEAEITALYVLKNPINESCEQSIYLPFRIELPDEIKIFIDNKEIKNFERIGRVDNQDSNYSYILFSINFNELEEKEIIVKYSERNIRTGDWGYKYTYNLRYIAETGGYWNNSLNATFTFKIKKDYYTSGIEGYNITEEGDYIVATKTFTNWIPDENIKISWVLEEDSSLICCVIALIFPIIVVVFFVLLLKKLRGDTINGYSSKYKSSKKTKKCPWCDKPVSTDYKICPYCGNQVSDKYHE